MRIRMIDDPERWQLTGDAAELYERYLVPAVTLPWAIDLVDRVGVELGDRVLDVACGTGVVARVAAPRAGHEGRVAALDVNPDMLAIARSLPSARGASIQWLEGSAVALPFDDGEFDVVLCQLGLQFFPDRRAALRELRRVVIPAGRAGVSVFTDIERNPAAYALSDAVDWHLGQGASRAKRHEHSLADLDKLRALLNDAGFTHVAVDTVAQSVRFESTEPWVRIQFAATPLAALLTDVDPSAREPLITAICEDVRARLARDEDGRGLAFTQEVHIALARPI
jgi:SAM-dependent methyltransferase